MKLKKLLKNLWPVQEIKIINEMDETLLFVGLAIRALDFENKEVLSKMKVSGIFTLPEQPDKIIILCHKDKEVEECMKL